MSVKRHVVFYERFEVVPVLLHVLTHLEAVLVVVAPVPLILVPQRAEQAVPTTAAKTTKSYSLQIWRLNDTALNQTGLHRSIQISRDYTLKNYASG